MNKNRVANEIIADVRGRGGRFLRRVNEPHEAPRYALADEPSVVEKTKQALRQSNKKAKRPAPPPGSGGESRKSAKGGKPVRASVVVPAPLTVPEAFKLKQGAKQYPEHFLTNEAIAQQATSGKDQQGPETARIDALSPMSSVRSVPVSSSYLMPAPASQAGLNPASLDAARQTQQMAGQLFGLTPAQNAWDLARQQQQHLAAATLQQQAALHHHAAAMHDANNRPQLDRDTAQYHLALQKQQRQAAAAAALSPEATQAARLAELQRMAHRQQQFEQAQQIQHAQAAAHAAAASEEAARRARQLEQMRMEQIDLLVRRQREAQSIDAQTALLAQQAYEAGGQAAVATLQAQQQALRLQELQSRAAGHEEAQQYAAQVSISPPPRQSSSAGSSSYAQEAWAGQQQQQIMPPPSTGLRSPAHPLSGQQPAAPLQSTSVNGGNNSADLIRLMDSREHLQQTSEQARYAAELEGRHRLNQAALSGEDALRRQVITNLQSAAALGDVGAAAALSELLPAGGALAASTGGQADAASLGSFSCSNTDERLRKQLGELHGISQRGGSHRSIESGTLAGLMGARSGNRAESIGAMSLGSAASPGHHGGGYGRGAVAASLSPSADSMRPEVVRESPLAVAQEVLAASKAKSGTVSGSNARESSFDDHKSSSVPSASANSDGSSKIKLLLTAHEMRERQEGEEAGASICSRLSEDVQPTVAGESGLGGGRRSLSNYYRSFKRNGGADPMDCS